MRKHAYDIFDKLMDPGSRENYFFGLPKISPGGQDGMAGHPNALGGNTTSPIKGVTPKNKNFPGKKKDKQKYRIMKKIAQVTTSISGASGSRPRESYVSKNIVAGPRKVVTEQKIPMSGPAMPRFHKQKLTAPLKGSANMQKTATVGSFAYGFCDELVNLI